MSSSEGLFQYRPRQGLRDGLSRCCTSECFLPDSLDSMRPLRYVCAVSTDDFHMFFNLVHVSHWTLRLWSQSTCQESIKFTRFEAALLASHVRFGSKADICSARAHVRFTP